MIARSTSKSSRRPGKTLVAMLATMAAFVGGGQALAPTSAIAQLDDGGGTCPNFLPLDFCAEQKEEETGGGIPDETIVIVEDVPDPPQDEEEEDSYDPGGRPIGTPPSSQGGNDGPVAQAPPRGGGSSMSPAPTKFDRLPLEKKHEVCESLKEKIRNLKHDEWILDQHAKGKQLDIEPGESFYIQKSDPARGSVGYWKYVPFKNKEQIEKRREELRAEMSEKKCSKLPPLPEKDKIA